MPKRTFIGILQRALRQPEANTVPLELGTRLEITIHNAYQVLEPPTLRTVRLPQRNETFQGTVLAKQDASGRIHFQVNDGRKIRVHVGNIQSRRLLSPDDDQEP